MSAPTDHVVDQLLARVENPDRLFRLLQEGPAQLEQLTGDRCHRSKLWRLASRGEHGVTLRTAVIHGVAYCTLRWLAEHFVAVGEARAAKATAPKPEKPRGVGRRTARRTKAGGSRAR